MVDGTDAQRRALGKAIKQALGSRGQVWLAQELGVTQTAVSKWVTGETVPSVKRLPAVERALGLPPGELVAIAYGGPTPARSAASQPSPALNAALSALDEASRALETAREEIRRLQGLAQ